MLNGRLLDRDRALLAGAVGAVSSGVVFVLIHASGGSAFSDAAVVLIWLMVAVRYVAASKPRRDRIEQALRLNSAEYPDDPA